MIRFAAIGLDHRHIYHMIAGLLDAGAECVGYWAESTDPKVVEGVRERFPGIAAFDDYEPLLEDPTIDLVVCAAVPSERAAIAIAAMKRGKDVMVDKPGVTTSEQLVEVQRVVKETGRIFSICFSERFVVRAVELAHKLVAAGEIGDVIQTLGLGPHRLNQAIRPEWFFRNEAFGGILIDIASHQIDQFLIFTGASDAQIVHSAVGHFGKTTPASFQDFGEINLKAVAGEQRGYVRVDWFTPDGLPTWGDGRLFIMGTAGTIEIRKYVDVEGRPGTDHILLTNAKGSRYLDGSNEPLMYFRRLVADIGDRTETAIRQQHVFTVSRLALEADAKARGAAS